MRINILNNQFKNFLKSNIIEKDKNKLVEQQYILINNIMDNQLLFMLMKMEWLNNKMITLIIRLLHGLVLINIFNYLKIK